ncbi:hypothetical protein ACR9LV_02505 [Helicobacter pylori]
MKSVNLPTPKKFPYDNAQRIVALHQQYHEVLTAHCQASLNFIGG